MGKLTTQQFDTLKAPGRHANGGNLYLNISQAGAKSWVFFYRFETRQREMGLGSLAATSLAEARVKALEALKLPIGAVICLRSTASSWKHGRRSQIQYLWREFCP